MSKIELIFTDEEIDRLAEKIANKLKEANTETWKTVKEKPSKSGVYRVKINSRDFKFKYAYYNANEDIWVYDDGTWLPFIATSYVTHWTEMNEQ